MQLSHLLAAYVSLPTADEVEITHVCLSSLEVIPGALFFAYPGETADGRDFIQDAIKRGAAAIVAEAFHDDNIDHANHQGVPVIYLQDVQSIIGPVAHAFYHYPSKNMQIIGVTGTNGKTSVAYILAQLFNYWGISAAIIGTLGIGKPGKLIATGVTTPDPISIQRSFVELKQQDCQVVIMEVSSHALIQGRVHGILFDAAIFTNLTQDHLDYHGTMEKYGLAKELFLTQHAVKNAIFNLDDPWCYSLFARYQSPALPCFGYSQAAVSPEADLIGTELSRDMDSLKGLSFSWQYKTKAAREGQSQLIGQFNLQNILAAATCLLSLGFKEEEILSALPHVQPVPGRLELLQLPGRPCCVIDYAHTPDALKKALLAVREFTSGKVYCIFGCGGDRDASKRPLMAAIAEQYADEICVTDDNPRNESSGKIVQDILQGFSSCTKVTVISDREEAIRTTLLRAHENDTVLIAGKGHEDYQIINNNKIFFSDRLVAETAMGM